MKRKSPYHHPVRSHTRSGVDVGRYERGKGSAPTRNPVGRPRSQGGAGYTVTLFFGGGSESHDAVGPTFTEAAQQGIRAIETPSIPRRMRIRRLNK